MPYSPTVETLSVRSYIAERVFAYSATYRYRIDPSTDQMTRTYVPIQQENVPDIWEELKGLDRSVRRRDSAKTGPIIRYRWRTNEEKKNRSDRLWRRKMVFIAI